MFQDTKIPKVKLRVNCSLALEEDLKINLEVIVYNYHKREEARASSRTLDFRDLLFYATPQFPVDSLCSIKKSTAVKRKEEGNVHTNGSRN